MSETIPEFSYEQKNIRIEHVQPWMEKRTKQKFDDWDRAIKEEWLTSNNETLQNKAYEMLTDPTIYAYAFLKDDKGEPLQLYSYQDIIINDPHKYVMFAAANQIGKSYMLCTKAIHFAVNNPGTTTVLTSKTLTQSKDLIRKIKRLINTSTLSIEYGDGENKTELYFKHYDTRTNQETGEEETYELAQSRIICVPATEAILGYPVDLLLMDELAFYEDSNHFYYQMARPRTYTTKGQIMVFSNPNGQQGVFHEMWEDPNFHKYRFDFLDCPTNTQEEFDSYASNMTREQIDSTLRAIFTSAAGTFFELAERRAMQDKELPNHLPAIINHQLYVFFDFAKVNDRTVRAIGYKTSKGSDEGVRILELKEYPARTEYDKIIDDLEKLIEEVGRYKIVVVGWDNTGVGEGIESFINKVRKHGIMVMPQKYSLQNKSSMYTLFKLLAERKVDGRLGITMPYIEECDKQLANLRFQKTSGNAIKVHHENERDRDDYPDCIAGLVSCMINPDSPGVTAIYIDPESGDNELDEETRRLLEDIENPEEGIEEYMV